MGVDNFPHSSIEILESQFYYYGTKIDFENITAELSLFISICIQKRNILFLQHHQSFIVSDKNMTIRIIMLIDNIVNFLKFSKIIEVNSSNIDELDQWMNEHSTHNNPTQLVFRYIKNKSPYILEKDLIYNTNNGENNILLGLIIYSFKQIYSFLNRFEDGIINNKLYKEILIDLSLTLNYSFLNYFTSYDNFSLIRQKISAFMGNDIRNNQTNAVQRYINTLFLKETETLCVELDRVTILIDGNYVEDNKRLRDQIKQNNINNAELDKIWKQEFNFVKKNSPKLMYKNEKCFESYLNKLMKNGKYKSEKKKFLERNYILDCIIKKVLI